MNITVKIAYVVYSFCLSLHFYFTHCFVSFRPKCFTLFLQRYLFLFCFVFFFKLCSCHFLLLFSFCFFFPVLILFFLFHFIHWFRCLLSFQLVFHPGIFLSFVLSFISLYSYSSIYSFPFLFFRFFFTFFFTFLLNSFIVLFFLHTPSFLPCSLFNSSPLHFFLLRSLPFFHPAHSLFLIISFYLHLSFFILSNKFN